MTEINPEFADNQDPRCACILLLDVSASMAGVKIAELNRGLKVLEEELKKDELASRRVEVSIITFGETVTTLQDFVIAAEFVAPTLEPEGNTPMGAAIAQALDLVRHRKATYNSNGITYFQPWIFMITDGAPTDLWESAAAMVHAEMKDRKLSFFAVGVEGADMNVLTRITPRALNLRGLQFKELFVWLSQSQKRVSTSKPGDQAELPPVNFGAPVTA